jgi:hypothetical protein
MAGFFPSSGRRFEPYRGFANAYPDGDATIARLVGPETSGTLGGGIVTYRRVRTTWHLPFDEIVCVLAGEMTVRANGHTWREIPRHRVDLMGSRRPCRRPRHDGENRRALV